MAGGSAERARSYLRAARAARRRVDLETHEADVERLEREVGGMPEGTERDALSRAATAERLRDIGYVATDDRALLAGAREAQELLDEIGGDDPDVAARLLLGRAQVAARLQRDGWEDQAEQRYTAAARRFLDSRELDEAAVTLADMAWTVHLAAGRLRAAQASLTEALWIGRDPSLQAAFLSQRAKLHLWMGELDAAEADIGTAWPIAQECDDRAVAYVAWSAANLASLRGQRSVVETWVQRGDRHRGSWATSNVTGLWYESEMIDALARVGAVESARERLERLEPEFDREPTAVGIAQVAFEARCGDPSAATEAWERIRDRADIEPWTRARLLLLLALGAERSGGTVGPIAVEAFEVCASLEDPSVLLRIEPEVAGALLRTAAEAGSVTAARILRERPEWRVSLLGGFDVRDAGEGSVDLTGRARHLVMLLAIAGQPVSRMRCARLLWPDIDDDTLLRGRIRRLLHRTRSKVPGLVEGGDHDRLELSGTVEVDLDRVTEAVARARLARDPVRQYAAAEQALEAVAGELLPGEVIDDEWLEASRHRLTRDRAWLRTVMAEHEADHGRDERAIHHARAALAVEPANEAAAALAVDLLRRTGRPGEAQLVLRSAEQALASLGLPSGPVLRGARARLEGGPSPGGSS